MLISLNDGSFLLSSVYQHDKIMTYPIPINEEQKVIFLCPSRGLQQVDPLYSILSSRFIQKVDLVLTR